MRRLTREELADAARRLGDPLLVLDEGEAHVLVAAGPEADARADGDVGAAREHHRELEGAELLVGLGIGAHTNIVPFGASTGQPARARPEIRASRRPR